MFILRSVLTIVLLLVACDSPSQPEVRPPDPAGPARVVIRTAILRLVEGDSAQLDVAVYDSAGVHVPNAKVTWLYDARTIATVDDVNRVHAGVPGWSRIIAQVGTSRDTVWVASVMRFATVNVGATHACAITAARELYCWGLGGRVSAARLDGVAPTLTPRKVTDDVLMFDGGWDHSCIVTVALVTSCWGYDRYGQLGINHSGWFPTQPLKTTSTPEPLLQISSSNYHTCGVALSERVYCWGVNDTGELGIWPDTIGKNTFCSPLACRAIPTAVPNLRLAQVSAGDEHSCGLEKDGRAWCWGANESGELGNGTQGDTLAPQLVKTELRFKSIAAGWRHTCALTVDGAVYCWGIRNGQKIDTPLRMNTAERFESVSVYSSACGIGESKKLYCWTDGQDPSIAANDGFTFVEVGSQLSCALGINQAVYCWGGRVTGTGLPGRNFPIMISPPGPVPEVQQ